MSRYNTIRKCFAVCMNRMLSVTNYSCIQTHHKNGPTCCAFDNNAEGDNYLSYSHLKGPDMPLVGDRTLLRLPTHALPALSTISSSTQCNARNATYSRRRGNYRNKDMPQYVLNIAIFNTMQYIVPSL